MEETISREHLFQNILKSITYFVLFHDFSKEEKKLIYKLINFKEK